MKLTRAASYAVHALVFMAVQKNSKPLASHNIAQARGIPERFLLKVLKPLVSVRILLSIKGPNGGYRLARTPDKINIAEIVDVQTPLVINFVERLPSGSHICCDAIGITKTCGVRMAAWFNDDSPESVAEGEMRSNLFFG